MFIRRTAEIKPRFPLKALATFYLSAIHVLQIQIKSKLLWELTVKLQSITNMKYQTTMSGLKVKCSAAGKSQNKGYKGSFSWIPFDVSAHSEKGGAIKLLNSSEQISCPNLILGND